MGRKWEIDTKGLESLASRIDKAGGSAQLKTAVTTALKDSKDYLNEQLDALIVPARMPAKGQYWTGNVRTAIDKESAVVWDGNEAAIKVGFDIKKAPESIFLVSGTPKMSPVTGLKTLLTGGGSHRKKLSEIQERAFKQVLDEITGGD